ncbi:MAG: nodulation protein NfeD [Hydrogenophaga sp.]|nr:nodulation protein NfeD [Hydrogenophaga sp.]MDO9505250.1 nodulation protein NfeD [Hydrogenophaga sp.]MDP2985006.1 nodulation protein NfeD [Hydrogenophaga sp.]MDP3626280.1 nodulation protein NfeD [Hydrogenophaga sp.]
MQKRMARIDSFLNALSSWSHPNERFARTSEAHQHEARVKASHACLSKVWLRLLAVLLIGFASLETRATPVTVLQVKDAIGPASADYVIRGIAKAADAGAPLVVIQLDTPGGLDISMRQIIQAILASRVPVAVFVSPEGARAASAGTYILYASHIAAMAPATTLGAATPVAIGLPGAERKPPVQDKGGGSTGSSKDDPDQAGPRPASTAPADVVAAKQVHDAAAFIRGLAQQRGRNAEWAERAVREAVSLTATEALREKVVDVIAEDVDDLLAQIDGRRVHIHGADITLSTRGLAQQAMLPDWRQRLLSVLANPSFALILMMIGIYGLMFEFSSPGFGLPGTVGAICLLLAMFALQLLPVNYAGLALIILGLALLAAEVVTPTLGVLGAGGVVAFVAGGLLLFDRDVPGLGLPLTLIFGLAASSVAVVLFAGGMALRARRRPIVSGCEEMKGAEGVVLERAGSGAWIQIHGERWRATSTDPLQPGQRVRVVGLQGLTLEVRTETGPTTPGDTA